mmetsp:Transcript_7864/g.18175  ORF Transcript_7864/g.18175 Transcript_7864/m.18175 type:complete len:1104 (+) Transcript_7864:186-3497(+)
MTLNQSYSQPVAHTLVTQRSIKFGEIDRQSFVSSLSGESNMEDLFGHWSKLDTMQIDLYGRTEEVRILNDAYKSICEKESTAEVILVHGASGTGKSSLVEALRGRVFEDGGFYVAGKFDQMKRGDPYSAIVSSFTDLCDLVLQSPDRERLVANIKQELGQDTKLLSRLVYNLSYILDEDCDLSDIDDHQDDLGATFTRFRMLCCAFLRAVASTKSLVLFLDDLQWADEGSMLVIKDLIADNESHNMLIIGAYRDDDRTEGNKIPEKLGIIGAQESANKNKQIHLKNLGLDCVTKILCHLTGQGETQVATLAEVVLHKTLGNPFFVLQFVELLESEKLLVCSEKSDRWEWDSIRIHQQTNVADNVVEVVASRVQRQHEYVQIILRTAAVIGFRFQVDLLEEVLLSKFGISIRDGAIDVLEESMNKIGDDATKYRRRLIRILDGAVREGMLERSSDKEYKFSHDRVQQCLYDMEDDPRERDLLHKHIGQILQHRDTRNENTKNTFLAADHLNRVPSHLMEESEINDLLDLNLVAAKLAKAKSAFIPAADYCRQGISRLDRFSKWAKHYQASLDLLTLSAELELCNGNSEASSKAVEEVLLYGKSVDDKLRAYLVKVTSLSFQGNFAEAVSVAQTALSKLGVSFPKKASTYNFVTELWKTNRCLRGKSDDDLLSIKLLGEDDKNSPIMIFLGRIAVACAFTNDTKLMGVSTFKMMRRTCMYGAVPYSVVAFAHYATFLSFMGKYMEAYRFGEIALKFSERVKMRSIMPRCLANLHIFALHWKQPMYLTVAGLKEADRLGMESGETEMAFLARVSHVVISIFSGKDLCLVEQELRFTNQQAIEYNQSSTQSFVLPWWQCVLNLMGQAQDYTVLTGEAMDERERVIDAELSDNTSALGTILFGKLILMTYLEEYESALPVIKELKKYRKALDAHASSYVLRFFSGLVNFSLFHKTQKKKYLVEARKNFHWMDNMVRLGVTNCKPLLAFFLAEQTRATNRKDAKAIHQAYDKAILEAQKQQLLHHEALANERVAQAMIGCDDRGLASKYIAESLQLYKKWNAGAKVEMIENEYADLLPSRNTETSAPDPEESGPIVGSTVQIQLVESST